MATAAVKTQRQLSRRTEGLMQRQGAVLASAPVKPEPLYPPILFTAEERDAATVRVWVEPLLVDEPAETWEQAGARTGYTSRDGEFGNRSNDLAAMRAQLRGTEEVGAPVEWGDAQRVAVLLSMDGGRTARKLVLEGSWSAILRSLPDPVTVQAWREAGATDFPVVLDAGDGQARQVTWVPIDEVPVVLQMEYEARGMAHDGR